MFKLNEALFFKCGKFDNINIDVKSTKPKKYQKMTQGNLDFSQTKMRCIILTDPV